MSKIVKASISIEGVNIEPAFQNREPRAEFDAKLAQKSLKEHVRDLAADIKHNGLRVPVDVFEIEGREGYTMVSGHHRLEAMKKLRRKKVTARVHKGTWEDAWVFSKTCNMDTTKPLSKPQLTQNAWQCLIASESNHYRTLILKTSIRATAPVLKVDEKTLRRMVKAMSNIMTNGERVDEKAENVLTWWDEHNPMQTKREHPYKLWTSAMSLSNPDEREWDGKFQADVRTVTEQVKKALQNMYGIGEMSPEVVIKGLETTLKELKEQKHYGLKEALRVVEDFDEDF